MATRQTSIQVYRDIQERGLLSERRWQVYDVVFRHGPVTASEAFEVLNQEAPKGIRFDSNTHARFTELREMGVLKELGTRRCRITGKEVILWDVTDQLPSSLKISKHKSDLAEIEQRLDNTLQEYLERYKSALALAEKQLRLVPTTEARLREAEARAVVKILRKLNEELTSIRQTSELPGILDNQNRFGEY